ncbi:MAG: sulfotransferase domain-containing protein, partial [Nitrospirae bacterium]|nr:sulfotransferase domain-containing protein [Nitrospirota bacterium]
YYEKLVENPEKELKRLCAFLDEEYSADMLNYHKSSSKSIPSERKWQHYNINTSPNTSRALAWKREMNPYDVAVFNKYAHKMLQELGYECSTEKTTGFAVNWQVLKIYTWRFMKLIMAAFKK